MASVSFEPKIGCNFGPFVGGAHLDVQSIPAKNPAKEV
jgi:hypothetical protein